MKKCNSFLRRISIPPPWRPLPSMPIYWFRRRRRRVSTRSQRQWVWNRRPRCGFTSREPWGFRRRRIEGAFPQERLSGLRLRGGSFDRRAAEDAHVDGTHLGLAKDTPASRPITICSAAGSQIHSLSRLGGLHHRYAPAA